MVKLATMQEYQNIKTFFVKIYVRNLRLKKFLLLKKLKFLCRRHMLLEILTERKLLKFSQKRVTKKIRKNLGRKK